MTMVGGEQTTRLIKKYPNRRLYDTVESRFITVPEIEKLVLDRVAFCVRDSRTGEDISRVILLQLISEREDSDHPVLSQQMLEQLVRIYSAGLQDMAQEYLERSLNLWGETQQLIHEHVTKPLPVDPATAMQELAERNLTLWRDLQTSFLKAYNPRGPEE